MPSMVADNTKPLFPFELLGKASIEDGGFAGRTEVKAIVIDVENKPDKYI